MSSFMDKVLAARAAKADLEAFEAAPAPVEAPAASPAVPLTGFAARVAKMAAEKGLPAPPQSTPRLEPVEVSNPPVPDLALLASKEEEAPEEETYWQHAVDGRFQASLEGKPKGFGWRALTIAAYNALVAEALPKSEAKSESKEAPKEEASKPQAQPKAGEEGFTLDSLYQAYLDARFTTEEANEELAAVKALLDEQPDLFSALAESPVPLNSKQFLAAALAKRGESFVLTGAAGTGKTTAQAAVVDILDKEGAFGTHDFKYIGEQASIAICAFTKVAVRNIQKAIRKNDRIRHYADHCMTIHALLEFEPVVEERTDANTGAKYDTRIFRPQRTAEKPLGITHLVIEEASMVGLDLWLLLYDALQAGVQIIFLGDINQLQPVFSKPVLGYALVKLPVIELTRVYRQALDSPIIANAHRVLQGLPIESSPCGKIAILPGNSPTKVGQSKMAMGMKIQLRKMWELGMYDPDQDMVLLAWNKQDMGTKSINESIATFLGHARDALVYHVRSARTQWYLAVGDKLLVDKRAGIITSIKENPKYIGQATKPPGFYSRDGTPILGGGSTVDFDAVDAAEEIDYSDFRMEDVEEEETKRASSHIVRVEYPDTPGQFDDLSSSGDFADNCFQFGYAMTVHKAQGSEYRKVIMMIHEDHKAFVSREFMYTGITRTVEEFICFIKLDLMAFVCQKQEIKGNGLADKIEYFNSGALADIATVPVEKPYDPDNTYYQKSIARILPV